MLLETSPCFGANALLFSTDRKPTIFPHSLKNGGSGQKAVPIRNGVDRLSSEDAWGAAMQFFIRKRCSKATFGEIIGVETHNLCINSSVLSWSEGVVSTPGPGEGVLRCFFGSGFLGFFDLLFGRDFGALLQAAVLRELPALGPDEVLGMLLAVLGLPVISS